jgi:D-alanyl-D-alanine dipeptidase
MLIIFFVLSLFSLTSKTDAQYIEQLMIKEGLVDIAALDTSIRVSLIYSSSDNFVGFDVYGEFDKCYLRPPVAKELVRAQKYLKEMYPHYSLIVFDASRPKYIQQIMWNSLKKPDISKKNYLADPKAGSLHNYGVAVDVSIVDGNGKLLDMGTKFDDFTDLAAPVSELKNLKKGLLTEQQVKNRNILRSVMTRAGFNGITTEWWHFSSSILDENGKKYPLIDSPALSSVSSDKDKEQYEKTAHGITFRLQIKISLSRIDLSSPVFKGLDVDYYYEDGIFKYTTGNFFSIKDAVLYKEKVRKLGFKDTFVAGFLNGKRIDLGEAIRLAGRK